MSSENLTDAINFELFQSEMEKFQVEVANQIKEYIKNCQKFYEDLATAWAGPKAKSFCKSSNIGITGQLGWMEHNYNLFIKEMYAAASAWASSFGMELAGYTEVNLESYGVKYVDNYGVIVPDFGLKELAAEIIKDSLEEGIVMKVNDVEKYRDEFVANFGKHVDAFEKLSTSRFGIVSSDSSLENHINSLKNNLKHDHDTRIKAIIESINTKIQENKSEMERGAKAAAAFFE